MSFNATGTMLVTEGGEHIVTDRGQTGFVIFGPYDAYEPGLYYVTFEVLPAGADIGAPDDLVAVVDVAADEGRTILATSNVFRQRAVANGGRIVLPFELGRPAKLEFRVQSTGQAQLVVNSARPVTNDTANASRYCPVVGLGETPGSGFARHFFDNFRYVYERGLDAALDEETATIEVNGIRLQIASAEDFQVLDEVFVKNDYRYALTKDHIVIDVGMNVGFASLFFASDPRVRAVYSFEPFAQPFARAMDNIARNPALATKITPYPVGLSDQDQVEVVRTVEGFTLGMTLKGLDRGTPETIQVRVAADVLRPLIEDAEAHGWAVVLKLDCEGSEFPIFNSLISGDLLGRINVIMIEWHKEWSPDCTQHDLIRPLNERGFVVFDQTEPSSQIAGMLYAVRV